MDNARKTVPLHRVDKFLVRVESRETPMQTASLNVFKIPDGAPPDYVRQLFATLSSYPVIAAPFSYRLGKKGRTPVWEILDEREIDIGYHVRRAALPQPGDDHDLAALAATLHSQQLDFSRPLWEFYLIEGLEHGRFATYLKMHHALADGLAVIKLNVSSMTESAEAEPLPPPWASVPRGQPTPSTKGAAKDAPADGHAKPSLFGTLWKIALAYYRKQDSGLVAPYSAPKCMLNGRVSAARRYAIRSESLERLRRVAKAAEATVNDVLLAMVGGALRSYLLAHDALPERPLHAEVPVALVRDEGDTLGSDVSGIFVTLATNVPDPRSRLAKIRESTRVGKDLLLALPKDKIQLYTDLIAIPLARDQLRANDHPSQLQYNVLVSNVPGPRHKLYFRGAEVEAMYPCSILFHGYPLNITTRGYCDRISFGIVGARESLPDLERITDDLGDALAELEAAFLPQSPTLTAVSNTV